MIQELLALALPVGKYILAAILMVIFYWFLFREKTSFNNSRMYLLSIALVAILISQFSIVVYTPPAHVVEIEAAPAVSVMSNQLSSATPPQTTTPTTVSITTSKPVEKHAEPNKYLALLTVKNIVLSVYIAVTTVLFMLLFVQFFKILGLKRRGRLTTRDGFEVIESDEIPTPFSFYKIIFLSPNLTGAKLDMILKHEQWHIKHRHYVDVFIIEVLVRLLWFNPVLWWVRRELRNVSEFHADRSVLDEGQDLYKYQTVILEEVMENNPYLANGFNNSFTRKRFIMMKNKCHIRFTTLRRALYVPFLVLVFSLFSFTIGKSEVRYVEKKTDLQEPHNSTNSMESTSLEQITGGNVLNDSVKIQSGDNKISLGVDKSPPNADFRKEMADFSNRLGRFIQKFNKIATSFNQKTLKTDLAEALSRLSIKSDQINIADFESSDKLIRSISRNDIKNSSENFSKIKSEIDELITQKISDEQRQRLTFLSMSIDKDDLISKIMADNMEQIRPKQELKIWSFISPKLFIISTTTPSRAISNPRVATVKSASSIQKQISEYAVSLEQTSVQLKKIAANTHYSTLNEDLLSVFKNKGIVNPIGYLDKKTNKIVMRDLSFDDDDLLSKIKAQDLIDTSDNLHKIKLKLDELANESDPTVLQKSFIEQLDYVRKDNLISKLNEMVNDKSTAIFSVIDYIRKFDIAIDILNKMIADNSQQTIKDNLYSVPLTIGTPIGGKVKLSDEFYSTVNQEDLIKCKNHVIKLKGELEDMLANKLKNIKNKDYIAIINAFLADELIGRIGKEEQRIDIIKKNSPSQYYKTGLSSNTVK